MADKNINEHLGKRLRMRRTMLGLSQEAIGNAVGIASQQVQKYEKGVNVMSAIRLYEFSQFLKVPVAYFYDGLDSKAPLLAEETAEFESEIPTASDRESIEVLKSFKRIKDRFLRKRVADLMRTLSLKDI